MRFFKTRPLHFFLFVRHQIRSRVVVLRPLLFYVDRMEHIKRKGFPAAMVSDAFGTVLPLTTGVTVFDEITVVKAVNALTRPVEHIVMVHPMV